MEAIMNKLIRSAIVFAGTVMCLSTVEASNEPTTFLGPTLRGAYTAPWTDNIAYSVAGEAGVRNFRVGATVGFRIDDVQRFKLSGEYLWQRIAYHFYTGDTKQWVDQGAVGGRYEYDFVNYPYNPQLDLYGFYSHAPSQQLTNVAGTITTGGVTSTFLDVRRIAGSNAGGGSPGVSFSPWQSGRIELDANYDVVSYHTHNTRSHDSHGWGGTAGIKQAFMDNFAVGVSAGIRQPFNDYEANLDMNNVQFYGHWTMGVYGNYLVGKNTLPNTWNAGLSADYFMDPVPCAPLKGENLKGEVTRAPDNFLDWTADPAVHMPQVLAIADEKVVVPDPYCALPVVTAPLPNTGAINGGTVVIDAAAAFTPAAGLTYTFTHTALPGGATVTGNVPAAGDVTIHAGAPGSFTVSVTATNSCGSATTSFLFTDRPIPLKK